MDALLSIGDFARMTLLSVKTLRHYHDVGLLPPAATSPDSGYRRYAPSQVATAQLIRRLRDLNLPIDQLKQLLQAPSDADRQAILLRHLDHLEGELDRTRQAVTALRALLAGSGVHIPVQPQTLPDQPALALRATLHGPAVLAWREQAFARLHAALEQTRLARVGPDGAVYSGALLQEERGEALAVLPVRELPAHGVGDVEALMLPGGRYAVAAHQGAPEQLDRTFAALGQYVHAHARSREQDIREHYPGPQLIEIYWPIEA